MHSRIHTNPLWFLVGRYWRLVMPPSPRVPTHEICFTFPKGKIWKHWAEFRKSQLYLVVIQHIIQTPVIWMKFFINCYTTYFCSAGLIMTDNTNIVGPFRVWMQCWGVQPGSAAIWWTADDKWLRINGNFRMFMQNFPAHALTKNKTVAIRLWEHKTEKTF